MTFKIIASPAEKRKPPAGHRSDRAGTTVTAGVPLSRVGA
jgi:hypothetical protein